MMKISTQCDKNLRFTEHLESNDLLLRNFVFVKMLRIFEIIEKFDVLMKILIKCKKV